MSRPEAPTKYRASCDGCYLAKLKCTKEKPTCPRCKNLGLTCTYSPSRRTGKPRASKPQATSTTATTTTTAAPITPSATTASSPSQILTWQPAPSSHPSAIVPTESLVSPFEKNTFAPNNDSSLSLMDTTMSDWSSSVTALQDLDSNLLAPWRNYLPNGDHDDSFFDLSDDLVCNFPGTMTPPPTADQHQPQPLTAPVTDAPPPSPNFQPTTCTCFNSLTQALHELHNQSRQHPALEATLSGSKEVTARGEQLLNCSCTSDSSLIMLFAALIAKYLSLYAANSNSNSSTFNNNNNNTNGDLISSPSSSSHLSTLTDLQQPTHTHTHTHTSSSASASASRVTIGKYTMDIEDGERLRMEIILMELQKLNTLLVKFRGKFAGVSVDGAYEGHTYETVLDFLNTRLKEAMNRLQRQKQKYQAPS